MCGKKAGIIAETAEINTTIMKFTACVKTVIPQPGKAGCAQA